MPADDDLTPQLRAINTAIQEWVNVTHGGAPLVTQALVIMELAHFDADGDHVRQVRYTVPSDNFSLTGALGLIEAARYYVRRDILHDDFGDD